VQLYLLFNEFIGLEGRTKDQVISSIISEVPCNLQDFCEYEVLKELLRVKQTQEALPGEDNQE